MRTLEQEEKYNIDHQSWMLARKELPSLKEIFIELDKHYSVVDGHSIFTFVKDNPEKAAICLFQMYETLRSIYIGKQAIDSLEFQDR